MSRSLIAIPVLLLALAGCAQTQGSSTSSASSSSSSSAPAAADSSSSSDDSAATTTDDSSSSSSEDPGTIVIGKGKWTYTDGLTVNVLPKIQNKRIGQYAAGGTPGGNMVVITVSVENGSGKTFDPALTQVNVTYGADGEQADSVFDSSAGLGDGFTAKIPNGRKAQAKYAFAVPKAAAGDLTVEVQPGFDYNSAVFTSK